jgi:hypothetical protein
MDESQIVDIWTVFKDNIDKKNIEVVAERFVDVCADYGADDEHFKNALGHCNDLDAAIYYYLDIDNDVTEDEEEDW